MESKMSSCFRYSSPFLDHLYSMINTEKPNPGQTKTWPQLAQCQLNDCVECERVFVELSIFLQIIRLGAIWKERVKHTFYLRLTLNTSIRCIFVCRGLIAEAAARPPVALSSVILWAWCIWTRRISGSKSQRHSTLQTQEHTVQKPDKSKKFTTFSTHTHMRAARQAPPTSRDPTNRRRVRGWAKGCSYLYIYPAVIRLRSAAVAQTQRQKTAV